MKLLACCLFLLLPSLQAGVTYTLRDARFFGETSARETLAGGAFTASTNAQLPVNFSTGGANPTVFDALSANQASPFLLSASNHVSAAANTDLTFNIAPNDPTNIVSLVQSRIADTNVTVTGGSGTGYLLPTFGIQGSFVDSHPTALGSIVICAGISSCTLSGVADSTGPAVVNTTFTPLIGNTTEFTFGDPFTFFFFISAGIESNIIGTLAPGAVTTNVTLQLLSLEVVDANGDPIRGAQIHSELVDIINTPEPNTAIFVLAGAMAAALLRKR